MKSKFSLFMLPNVESAPFQSVSEEKQREFHKKDGKEIKMLNVNYKQSNKQWKQFIFVAANKSHNATLKFTRKNLYITSEGYEISLQDRLYLILR